LTCLTVSREHGLAGQFREGETTTKDCFQHFAEASNVRSLPLIVPERLLVQIAEEMERLNADVGSLDASLKQRPKVLNPVSVNVSLNVALGMVHELMDELCFKPSVGSQLTIVQF
jgi:hypothetical protein